MDYGTSEIVAGVYLSGPPAAPQYRSLENPNLPLNDPAVWEAVFHDSFGTETGIKVTAEKALMYAPLWHAVSLISDDVARLPLHVYKRRPDISEDARERDRDHALNYVLSVAANDELESVKFWNRFMVHALLWGNAYAFIDRDGTGRPAELINLLPDRTRMERADGQLVYVTETSGTKGPKLQAILPEDVIHVEGLNFTGGPAACVFRMARNSIALGLAQEQFASRFFKHGGRVGGILELPASMSKTARDTMEEGFKKTYEGSDAAFKTVVLRDNAKFHAAQMSMRDSQMVEGTEAQTRAIAHWFKLAPSKLGLSDSVSYNSKAEDNQNYLDATLSIWLTRIAACCNYKLLSQRSSGSHFVEHNVSALLRMDQQKQAEMISTLIACRVINPNEGRAKLNMLPYEGGDEFVNPNTMKSGSEPAEDTAPEEEPAEETPPPKRDAAYMRVLFGITSRARDKAKRPKAFLEWIDGNLAPHRAEWKHLWGDKPFPFDELRSQFNDLAGYCTEQELPIRVETICQQWEES